MFKVKHLDAAATATAVCHLCKDEEHAAIWAMTDTITQCVSPVGWAEDLEGYMLRLYCPKCQDARGLV